jgi:hypothetical protein
MKTIDDCRSAIARHHGSKVKAGVDLIGSYLDIRDATTLLMAECYFQGRKRPLPNVDRLSLELPSPLSRKSRCVLSQPMLMVV